jgi:hypothetical protein
MTYDLGVIKRQKYFGPPTPSAASGGLLSYYTLGTSTYAVHTFVSSGVFKLAQPINTAVTASILLVAGGGGGGSWIWATSDARGSGGGAGGLLTTSSFVFSNTLTYIITVGGGGTGAAGGTNAVTVAAGYGATSGTNSTIVAGATTYYNAIGGGRAGGGGVGHNAGSGGSGGGSGGLNASSTAAGSGTAGQGNNGGGGSAFGGGGGGASGVGLATGPGGTGTISTITGASIYYAGGGAGASTAITNGGLGGGGQGGIYNLSSNAAIHNGTKGLGGGGGGGGVVPSTTAKASGSGGSGVIIISYPVTLPASTFNDPDPYFNRVVALVQDTSGDLRPTHITDASTNNTLLQPAVITDTGITPSLLTPFINNDPSLGSTYFTSTNCLTNITASALFAFGSNSFTIECWVYENSKSSTSPVIVSNYATTLAANGWAFHLDRTSSANKFSFYAFNGTLVLVGSTSINLRQWYHVAVSRVANTISMYLNGVLDTSTSYTSLLDAGSPSTYKIYIGDAGGSDSTTVFNGYISNLRIVNSKAVYTGNFEVPTRPLTITQISNPNIATLTGSDTTFLSLQTSVAANNSRFFNAALSTQTFVTRDYPAITSYTPYGRNWSVASAAGSGVYITATNTVSSLIIGTSDFTIESWIYVDAPPGQTLTLASTQYFSIIARLDSLGGYATGSWGLQLNPATGTINFNDGTNDFFSSGSTVTSYTWHHVAITRQSTTLSAWLDGSLYGTTTTSVTNLNGVGEIRFLKNKTVTYTGVNLGIGYLSNTRVTTSTVYTSSFIPPSSPLSAIPGTLILTNQNSRLQDNSGNNWVMGLAGNPAPGISVSKFSPFPNQPYNTTSQEFVGSSIYFNQDDSAFSDYDGVFLPAANTSSNLILTGDFTIEMWVNCTEQAAVQAAAQGIILSRSTIYSSTGTYSFLIDSAYAIGKLIIRTGNPITTVLTSNSYITNSLWNHIAVTRTGSTVVLYVNGVQDSSTVNTGTWDYSNISIGMNPVSSSAGQGYKGYLCDLRIINGSAIYPPAVTVPISYLVVAGGGAGGSNIGGGGGAGGMITGTTVLSSSNTATTIMIGAGGVAAQGNNGTPAASGGNSVFGSITATGGGGGGNQAANGGSGGSGGGGGYYGGQSGGAGTAGQGNNGAGSSGAYYSGGGGGKGAASTSAEGGAGLSSSISGTSVTYARGGSGGYGSTASASGAENTGNGGSGGPDNGAGGNGGKGVVIVSHSNIYPVANVTGSPIVSTTGSNIVYVFTASGTISLSTVTSFTPPQFALKASNNTQTVLLLQPNTPFLESSGKSSLLLVNDTSKSTLVTKYGTSSLYLDGTSDGIMISDDRDQLGTSTLGDFVVEMWIYNTAAAGTSRKLVSRGGYSSSGWGFAVNSSGVWGSFILSSSETAIPTAAASGLNTWQHVAVVRLSGILYLYVNGIPIYYTAYTDNEDGRRSYIFGAYAATTNGSFQGYIDGIRITKGVARYTGQFTPPTQAFPTR